MSKIPLYVFHRHPEWYCYRCAVFTRDGVEKDARAMQIEMQLMRIKEDLRDELRIREQDISACV